jgi:glycerate dehydrogenase
MPLKIVFLDVSTLGDVDNLHLISELGIYSEFDFTSAEETIDRIQGAEIVITNKVIIDRNVMDASPSLKLICISATGMNNVDLDHAREKGIQVKNVAGYSTESVAQSTFSMLFHLLHANRYYDDYVRSGAYSNSRIFTHYGPSFSEIKGKRFGIIGMGTIGKRVAEIAGVFGAEVVYFSTSGKNMDTGYLHVSLNELLSTSDFISIHCPLNGQTMNLIDADQLSIMKRSSLLLNMGRGGIINEKALADAIDQQSISGACVDVLTQEPIRPDSPLANIELSDRIFITPHNAWASRESRRLLVEKLVYNIKNYIQPGN